MRRLPWVALALAVGGLTPAHADEAMAEMEKYYVVLLKRPTNAPKLDDAALEALQKQHLGHLQALYEAGKIVLAGPFDEQRDEALRGMCLYRVASLDEARTLAESDPAVKARRLVVEVFAWWVKRGTVSFKPPPVPASK